MIRSLLGYLRDSGFFHLFSAGLLTRLFGFLAILVVAGLLSPSELGDIRVLQSYTMPLIAIASCGIPVAVFKLCSENRPLAEREWILRLSVRRSVIASLAALVLFGALALSGVFTSSARLGFWLAAYAILLPFAVLTTILVVYLQALKRVRAMARAQTIVGALAFVVVVAATWAFGFAGFVIATVAAHAAGFLAVLRGLGMRSLRGRSGEAPATFASLAFWGLLANVLYTLSQYADVMVLDHLTTDRDASRCAAPHGDARHRAVHAARAHLPL